MQVGHGDGAEIIGDQLDVRAGKGVGLRAEDQLRQVLQHDGDAHGADQGSHTAGVAAAPDGPVGEALDGHAQYGRAQTSQREGDQNRNAHGLGEDQAEEGAHHEDVAMGEIDDA